MIYFVVHVWVAISVNYSTRYKVTVMVKVLEEFLLSYFTKFTNSLLPQVTTYIMTTKGAIINIENISIYEGT